MKSRVPKVLHRVARPADDRARPGGRRPLRPASTVVIVGHEAEAAEGGARAARRAHLRGAGATAWHRPRAADDRAGAGQAARNAGSAVGRRAAAVGDDAEGAGGLPHVDARRRHCRHRQRRQPARLRPDRPIRPADCTYCRGAGRQPGRTRRSARSIPAFTPSTSRPVRRAFARSRPRMRRANTTCRIWSPSTGRMDGTWRRSLSDNADEIRGINSRAELAEMSRIDAAAEKQRADGARRHDRGSGDRLHRPRRADRRRHDHSSRRHDRRRDDDRRRLESPQRRAHRRARRSAMASPILDHCVITDSTVASGAIVGPFAHLRQHADVQRRRASRQLRRAEEYRARRRLEIAAPRVPRRRGDRRTGQHRRRDDHVQLRRREEEHDANRRRSVHRQRHAAGRAGHDRQRRLRRQRHDHSRGRAGRRAGGQRRQTAQHRRLGRTKRDRRRRRGR